MDTTVSVALIAGASGILGALAGGGALLRSSRNDRRAEERAAHDAALVELYAAALSLGWTYHVWADMQPESENKAIRAAEHMRLAMKIAGHPSRFLVERIGAGADRLWQAVGRGLAVATPQERAVVKAVESAFGDWQLPKPMPATWAPAIHDLRELLESLAILPRP